MRKQLEYRRTGPRHSVATLEGTAWPKKASAFRDLNLRPSRNAVVVKAEGKIVGFFRYTLSGRVILAQGTWVQRSYRGRGIGTQLWLYALCKEKATRVDVCTVSRSGHRLVRRLAKSQAGIVTFIHSRLK
jgi:predicted GNAT family acetyltransferase